METELIDLDGDTPGIRLSLAVHRFCGLDGGSAPSVYLQAALHADELPGAAALHFLGRMLRAAEAEKRIRGDITLVPLANPIGGAQRILHDNMGRFDIASGTNFNRAFPALDPSDGDPHAQLDTILADAGLPATERLKHLLLSMAMKADIVLDLHCDAEAIPYVYLPNACWPDAADLPALLSSKGVILWDEPGAEAFEEAAISPFLMAGAGSWPYLSSTVEFRGQGDVSPEIAEADARGLFDFLVVRGVIAPTEGEKNEGAEPWDGTPTDINHIEVVTAPAGGLVLYHAAPGDAVAEGDVVATIVSEPATEKPEAVLTAPQAGTIMSRRRERFLRRGDDVFKLLGTQPNAAGRTGGALDNR